MKRLHITGCPRSGTTLLMEQVSTCFESDSHCEHEQSIFDPVALSGGLYLSKQSNDIKHLRHIFHRDGGLHIIYVVRDPRSVITSKHGGASGQWLQLLEGVEALEYPCRYPERTEILKEWEKSFRVYLKSRRYLRRLALSRRSALSEM